MGFLTSSYHWSIMIMKYTKLYLGELRRCTDIRNIIVNSVFVEWSLVIYVSVFN